MRDSDDLTYATHESQALRIERDHSAPATETAWTVAAHQMPVSDRTWYLTAIGATPIPMLQDLLHELADGHGWDTPVGEFLDEASIIVAAKPATDAGWKHTFAGAGSTGPHPTARLASNSTPSPPNDVRYDQPGRQDYVDGLQYFDRAPAVRAAASRAAWRWKLATLIPSPPSRTDSLACPDTGRPVAVRKHRKTVPVPVRVSGWCCRSSPVGRRRGRRWVPRVRLRLRRRR